MLVVIELGGELLSAAAVAAVVEALERHILLTTLVTSGPGFPRK